MFKKIFMILLLFFMLTSCKVKRLENSELEYRNKITYEKSSKKKFTGIKVRKYEDGSPKEEVTYKNGIREGKNIFFHKNGKPAIEGFYKNGKPNGKKTFWDENGKKQMELHYLNGVRHGKFIQWNKNGTLKTESNFKFGELDGISKSYDKNGVKRMEAFFKNGKRSIKNTQRWDSKGNKIK